MVTSSSLSLNDGELPFMCCSLVICVLRNSLYVWIININGLNIFISLILMVSIIFVVSLILMVSIIFGLSHTLWSHQY